jgi:hypothetical protein
MVVVLKTDSEHDTWQTIPADDDVHVNAFDLDSFMLPLAEKCTCADVPNGYASIMTACEKVSSPWKETHHVDSHWTWLFSGSQG